MTNRNVQQNHLTYKQLLHNSENLSASWRKLCTRFLPLIDNNSSWRYSRSANPDDAEQGWKLHISATILTACEVLEKVAPFLISRGLQFKAPASLQLLLRLSNGLSYGYTQVGKFLTVYPRNVNEAVSVARRLHRLTAGMPAPAVPFDLQYYPDSCVYYRYGAFKRRETEILGEYQIPTIRDLSGSFVPDSREEAKPSWVDDPFQPVSRSKNPLSEKIETPFEKTYHIFRALKQRGKGGVYQAIDIRGANEPRLCIIKEGRRHGEVGWDGCDGFQMVKREAEVLRAMQTSKVGTPHLYSTFEVDGNYYLAAEFIEGNNLEQLMQPRKRRFSVKQVLKYSRQIAELLNRIHSAGWVWRDCKPANLIVTKDGCSLRPLDFEGACRINQPNASGWKTIEFSAPQSRNLYSNLAIEAEDIYSFGAVIYYLLTGKIYQPDSPLPVRSVRRRVPQEFQEIIEKMLVLPVQKKRPPAKSLVREFDKLLFNA